VLENEEMVLDDIAAITVSDAVLKSATGCPLQGKKIALFQGKKKETSLNFL
jgi:hypothetical protein